MFKRFIHSIKQFLGNSLTSAGMWGWTLPGSWSKADLIRQYTRVVFTVISAIAEEAAKIAFTVEKENGEGDGDNTIIKKHDFLRVIKHPNPDYSQFQFLELHFTYLKLTGESYWYILKDRGGRPRQFYLLRPELMQVFVPKDNNPLGLVGGYVLCKPDGTKIPFDKDEILHHKMPNPGNPYYGMGPIEAAKTYIQTENFASDWTKNSLFNAGRPSGIVTIKGTIDKEQFDEIKTRFKEEYSGTTNAGKTLFIKGSDGLEYQKLGMELQELAIKELKDMTRDDIMMMLRVSKTMLGISEGVTLNNARESKVMFKENIILAEWDRLTDHLTAFLLPMYREKEDVHIGYVQPDLSSDADRIADQTNGFNKWYTGNDIRKKKGLKPLKGLDVIWQSIGLVPIHDDKPRERSNDTGSTNNPNGTGNEPQEDPKNPGYDMNGKPMPKKPADKKPAEKKPDEQKSITKSPMCRMKNETKKQCVARKIPEIMKDDPSISQDQAIAMAESMCSKACKTKDIGLTQKDLFEEQMFDLQDSFIPIYKKEIDRELALQEKEILEKNGKKSLEWLFDLEVSKQRLIGRLVPLGIELMIRAAKLALSMANDEDTDFMISPNIRDYLHDRVSRITDAMNATTTKLLSDSINQGLKDGESLAKLTARVREIFDNATQIRSERIARTESLAASNEGAVEAYRQSPMVNAKQWSASPGCCEFCQEMDGKIVGLTENFATQGTKVHGEEDDEFVVNYEDIEHPPLHPNCRCAILPVIGE